MPFQVWIVHPESDTNAPLQHDDDRNSVPLFATEALAKAFIETQGAVDGGLGWYDVKEVA